MRRLLRPALAAALLLVAVPVVGASGSPGDELVACRSKNDAGQPQVTLRKDRWVRIAAPKMDAGEGQAVITAFATTPNQRNGVYVTNGQVVKFSADAGCTWNVAYRGSGIQSPSAGAPYTPDVFTAMAAPADSRLWLSSYDDVGGVHHPHMYVGAATNTAGAAFQQFDIGLPQVGTPVSVAAGAIGEEAYVLIDELPDASSGDVAKPTRHLYTNYQPDPPEAGAATGGAWKEVVPPQGFGRIDGFTRQDNRLIWIWGGNKVAVVTDVAGTPAWHTGTAAGQVVTIDVDPIGTPTVISRTPQGTLQQLASPEARLSTYNGVPIDPVSFTHGERQSTYVTSGTGGTWGFDNLKHRWVDITPKGVPAFSHLEMASGTTGRIVLGQRPDALYRWDTYWGETFIEPPPPPRGTGDGNYPALPDSTLKGAVLSPLKQVVTVTPGTIKDVPVLFRVPPAPTPLDVFFIMDTTYSMSPAIIGLQKAINRIAGDIRKRLGIQACFGVGDVKDLAADPSNPAAGAPYTYKTLLPVSPCDTAPGLPMVHAAVAKYHEGGGGDTPEAQTVALQTAVTDQALSYPPVPAGQGAHFRSNAFKVIVLISDTSFHQGSGYPTIQQAVHSLNVADVKVVSILVGDGNADHDGGRAAMQAVAIGTNSMAPSTGVDCNGDGGGYYGDLGPGAPLVCEIPVTSASDGSGSTVNIGPAIFGLLLAVKDPGTIAVDVTDNDHVVQAPIRGLTSAVKDLKFENGLRFTLPVRCSKAQDGKDLPVGLFPTVRSLSVGLYGEVVVQCRSKPLVVPVIVPPPPEDPIIVSVPRPPVAAAAPGPGNAPAQPISNINPNAGFSQQEEQQLQVAAVTQDATEIRDDEATELAMSGLDDRHRNAAQTSLALGAAAAMSAAAAYAHRRRTQRRVAVRYVRA